MNLGHALRATFASRGTIAWVAGCAVLGLYLFATRPPELPSEAAVGRKVPIERVFRALAAENDAARGLYTAEIVTAGQKSGLAFDERWRDRAHDAGPLPALFLREAASAVRQTPVPLGLFLGSDFPISPSNVFKGEQDAHFQNVRTNAQPEFFYAADLQLYTAMFPDYAVGAGCVTCHNEHADSPKKDWKLRDMMGATTWSYPSESVTPEEMVQIISVLRGGLAKAYDAYLAKTASFGNPPEIGERWPRDGYFVPSAEVFMREFEQRASPGTVNLLLAAISTD
jgi:adenylate cyclase